MGQEQCDPIVHEGRNFVDQRVIGLPALRAQPMVGILNSAPARMPVGQREVTAFCLV